MNADNLSETLQIPDVLFSAKLPTQLRELVTVLQICLDEKVTKEHWQGLQRVLYTLAEAADAASFSELSQRASYIEKQLELKLADDSILKQESSTQTASQVAGLLRWATTDLKGGSVAQPALSSSVVKEQPTLPIYLFNNNALIAKDLALQLMYFGYEVVIISELSNLVATAAKRIPAAMIMDFGQRAEILAGAAEIARIRQNESMHFPILCLSTRSNFEARLIAVRAGADGYFIKPVDVVALIDRLDTLTVRKELHPYRILIISDEATTAHGYATVLSNAGMDVYLLHKSTDIFRVLGEYRPELILMDVHTPACSGIDLAKMIRQDNTYLDVPIIFLSNDSDVVRQIQAIESGADDFLPKPITPAHLVSSLSSRAERYRALRGLIMRDGLTSLYNHSAIKEQLLREMSSARRSNVPLALAMIDLDFFKQVNDTYGHPVGDQVIRALSRLLQQRLRRSDIIGRYGGEEFAVILPNTSAAAAQKVLDQIRESFSKIRHHGGDTEFTGTFSAGVAQIEGHLDGDALFAVADSALYNAKHNGRNQVSIGS
jgi:diguanylate cyclase (GGDEF)-like protein